MGFAKSFNIKSLVKQGTVIGPLLCSASIAEFCEECGPGGAVIGNTTIRTLAFVDNTININSDVIDVLSSHESIKCFSEKKNLPLSPTKCFILAINCSFVPNLEINGKQMGKERKVRYLGDVVNSSGTMCDTIADRVARGTRCIVNCFSEVTDVTMGVQQIKTLILLYNSIFIPTVLFN